MLPSPLGWIRIVSIGHAFKNWTLNFELNLEQSSARQRNYLEQVFRLFKPTCSSGHTRFTAVSRGSLHHSLRDHLCRRFVCALHDWGKLTEPLLPEILGFWSKPRFESRSFQSPLERGKATQYRFLAAFNGTQPRRVWSHSILKRGPVRFMVILPLETLGTLSPSVKLQPFSWLSCAPVPPQATTRSWIKREYFPWTSRISAQRLESRVEEPVVVYRVQKADWESASRALQDTTWPRRYVLYFLV